jgi:hypothetical protein
MRLPTLAAFAVAASLAAATVAPAAAGIVKYGPGVGQANVRIPALVYRQAAGLAKAPVTQGAMQRLLSIITTHARPNLKANPHANVGLWVSDLGLDYLLGQTANGVHNVTAIDTLSNNCFFPIGIKVDHHKNVWVACNYNYSTFANGMIQEYSSAGALLNTYNDEICNPTCSFAGYPTDEAWDASGNVFAANSSDNSGNGTVSWWPALGGNPTVITDSNLASVDFMDTDSFGNLYVDGYAYSGGYELDKISTPTTTPTVTVLIPGGTIGFPGGVYVSTHLGVQTLNVTDQIARTITGYPLPFGPLNRLLGPTVTNVAGSGEPVSGGFNKANTAQADGDASGWLDVGKVVPNTYAGIASINFSAPEGAAYSPSDK